MTKPYVQHLEVATKDGAGYRSEYYFVHTGLVTDDAPRSTDCHDDHTYYFGSDPHDVAVAAAFASSVIFNETLRTNTDGVVYEPRIHAKRMMQALALVVSSLTETIDSLLSE